MSIVAIRGVLNQNKHVFVHLWTLKWRVFLELRTSVKTCSSFKTMSSQRCALEQRPIKQWAWEGALNYRSLYIYIYGKPLPQCGALSYWRVAQHIMRISCMWKIIGLQCTKAKKIFSTYNIERNPEICVFLSSLPTDSAAIICRLMPSDVGLWALLQIVTPDYICV